MEIIGRPWGHFLVYDHFSLGDKDKHSFKVKKLVVNPLQNLSMQRHLKRDETWVVLTGVGSLLQYNNNELVSTALKAGSVVHIAREEWHCLVNIANSHLILIEIQGGSECDELDIERK
jgi:mannose-6-phosphate isomerase-like protein (cupin superfamily)